MDYHNLFVSALLEPNLEKVRYYLKSKKVDPNRQIGVTVDSTGGRIKHINVGSYLFLAVTHYFFRGHNNEKRVIVLKIINALVKEGARADQVDIQNGVNVLEFAASINDRHLVLALLFD